MSKNVALMRKFSGLAFMSKGLGLLFLLSVLNVSVYANGASFGRIGEVVFPLEDRDIKMVSEHISGHFIDEFQFIYEVNCVFNFFNLTAENRDLEVGFPIHGLIAHKYESQKGSEVAEGEILVHVDGEKVPVTVKEGIKNPELGLGENYPLVFVFPVGFKPHEKKKVEIIYKAWYFTGDGHFVSGQTFMYVTKTGALWRGNIENAEFRFALPDKLFGLGSEIFRIYAQPAGYKIVDNHIVWKFKDWKPKEDISIQVDRGDITSILSGRIAERLQSREYAANKKLYSNSDLDLPLAEEFNDPSDLPILRSALLWVLRNEIYARHGYKFENPVLAEYFSGFSWYSPKETFSDSEFSSIEKKNLKFIRQQEKKLEKEHYLRYVFKKPPAAGKL